MADKSKGTRYATFRKLVKAKGEAFEKQFISMLNPVEQQRYTEAMAISWVDHDAYETDKGDDCIAVAAKLFFPGQMNAIAKVGEMVAKENMSGLYKIFLLVPTVEYVVKRITQLWQAYNSAGEVTVDWVNPKYGKVIIRKYPGMSKLQRQYLTGYIKGVVELTRAKNVTVKLWEADPNAWTYHVKWE